MYCNGVVWVLLFFFSIWIYLFYRGRRRKCKYFVNFFGEDVFCYFIIVFFRKDDFDYDGIIFENYF